VKLGNVIYVYIVYGLLEVYGCNQKRVFIVIFRYWLSLIIDIN